MSHLFGFAPNVDPTYNLISYQSLLAGKFPPEQITFTSNGVRVPIAPFGFHEDPEDGLSVAALDTDGKLFSLPVNGMPGLMVSPGSESGVERGKSLLGFMNYKQEQGIENYLRIVVPKGFAYGIHPGHMGQVVGGEVVGMPEAPSYYLVARQVGVVGLSGKILREFSAVDKHFSLRRIEGFLGSPNNDADFRARYNIY